MQKCVEARYWPDSLSDVPEDRLEELLIHAERCPYHEELFLMEERPFKAAARLARSLTSDGHLPSDHEDRAEIEENHRNYNRWVGSGELVQSLSLRYRGEEVARHERFLGLDTRVTRELDAPGDLQVWKLADDVSEEDIFLGVYPIRGFRHENKPEYLELANGQKVKLKVKYLLGNKYEIEFACAEPDDIMETLEGSDAPLTKSNTGARGQSALGASNFIFIEESGSAPWQLLTPRNAGIAAAALTLLILCAGVITRGNFSPASGKAQSFNNHIMAEKNTTAPQSPPEAQGDSSQRGEKPGADKPKESVTVSFTPGLPLKSERVVRREQGRPNLPRKKVEPTAEIGANSLPKERASETPRSVSAWYFTNGPKPQMVWIRTGDDISLRDKVLSALPRSYGQKVRSPDLELQQEYRVIQFNFKWKDQVGVLEAQVTDEANKPLMTFVCQSQPADLEQAREQAVRGVILDLVRYFKSTSDVGWESNPGRPNSACELPAAATADKLNFAGRGGKLLECGF